ncbi:MAG: ABC transporter permease [Ardenticatenaceae bacterium]
MIESLRHRQGLRLAALLSPAALWLALFFLVPLLIILAYSFATRSATGMVLWSPTIDNYVKLLATPDFLRIFVRSFWYAILTTAICLLIGYPMALCIVRSPITWRTSLLFLVIIPFWTNFVVRTYAWKVLLNNNGVVNNLLRALELPPMALINTPTAVMIGLVYGALPFMVLPLYAALERFDFTLMEAASDLGANRLQAFARIMLPLTMPGITAGSVLVFIPTVGSYIVPDILGGAKVAMLGNTLALQFGSGRNWPFGSAIALIFMLLLTAGVVLYFRTVPDDAR